MVYLTYVWCEPRATQYINSSIHHQSALPLQLCCQKGQKVCYSTHIIIGYSLISLQRIARRVNFIEKPAKKSILVGTLVSDEEMVNRVSLKNPFNQQRTKNLPASPQAFFTKRLRQRNDATYVTAVRSRLHICSLLLKTPPIFATELSLLFRVLFLAINIHGNRKYCFTALLLVLFLLYPCYKIWYFLTYLMNQPATIKEKFQLCLFKY